MNKYIGENRLTYLWGKIKAFVSNAISGKVDKVSSSTDNAIVRFDGTSGDIQNSGVTIDDSNHLTAAKLITSGGTSSQFVKGDGSLDSNAYATTTNAVKNNDIIQVYGSTLDEKVKTRLYDRAAQDTLYAANSRFIVTHAAYDSTDDSFLRNISTDLFKAHGQQYSNRVDLGEYGVLYIGNVAETKLSSTTTTTASICTYSEGWLILTFYGSMRPGEILEAKGWFRNDTSWRSLTVTENNKCVYRIAIPNVNNLKAIRIKYSGSNLGSEGRTSLSDVAYLRVRDVLSERCLVTKYPSTQSLYGILEAPKFVTRNGTSSQFVKGDGSLDSASYAPLASPALTGTPTAPTAASGTNTTQIATTAFVQSAVPKDYQVDYSKQYLTAIARENGTISFNIAEGVGTNLITSISYSMDNGATWTTTTNQDNKEENLVITVNLNAGDKVLWKGIAETISDMENEEISYFTSTCEFDIQGNVMSLCYGDNFIDEDTLEYAGQFGGLFGAAMLGGNCSVVNAKNLSLPATTLSDMCYYCMFRGCTALITAPVLAATTLAGECYENMFYGCTSLTSAPVLPATTLSDMCYYSMFADCTSLTTAPALPATTLAESCYDYMFYSCTSLTIAPELPATTLAEGCYQYMFQGCTNLRYIKAMFTTTPSNTYTYNWVNNIAATGTFVKNDSATWTTTGTNAVPTGWTVRTESEMEHVTKGELDDVVGNIETLLASI